jgi:hypothetical protein
MGSTFLPQLDGNYGMYLTDSSVEPDAPLVTYLLYLEAKNIY